MCLFAYVADHEVVMDARFEGLKRRADREFGLSDMHRCCTWDRTLLNGCHKLVVLCERRNQGGSAGWLAISNRVYPGTGRDEEGQDQDQQLTEHGR